MVDADIFSLVNLSSVDGPSSEDRADMRESIMHQLIDEEALGVVFEMHRAIKLGYYELVYPDDSYEKHDVIDMKGYDIFGNTPQSLQKNVECQCPNCDRTLGATKFAPHLEKCMGMGRNSTRLANRKNNHTPVESDQEGTGVRSEEEDEWVYPERRVSKKARREKNRSSSPLRVSNPRPGPGRPPKNPHPPPPPTSSSALSNTLSLKPSLQQHNVASFMTLPSDYKISLLQQICGVVSERTGRLCTRSVNCPQHTEDQRQSLRRRLLSDRHLELSLPPQKRRRDRTDSPDVHGGEGRGHSSDSTPPPPAMHTPKRRKNKTGKKTKRSNHGSMDTNRQFSNMF